MSTIMVLRVVTVAAALAMLAGVARADDDADSLAGPRIAAKDADKRTIVRRDFQGNIERLEERPEIAAVRMLPLDEATRAVVDTIIAERAVTVSQITLENYEAFLRMQAAFQGGAPATAEARQQRLAIVRELREIAKPLFEPPFVETLAKAIPSEQAEELRTMVTEYREAITASEAQERARQSGDDAMMGEKTTQAEEGEAPAQRAGRRATRGERIRRVIDEQVYEVRQVGREMGRSFQNFVADKQQKGEELYAMVEATPEQRAKIDAILRADGEGAAIMPTDAQRRERFQKILAVLTPEQRRKFMDAYRK